MSADGGPAALDLLGAQAVDLVLLDVVMPEMDGFEVCRRIKADPATKDLPVLFLSSFDSAQERITGFRAGAVDFIQKPFSEEEVILRILTQWDLRRLRKDLESQVRDRTRDLQTALEDKKILMRELQHRVKNHLSLVTSLLTLTEASGRPGQHPAELLEKARSRVLALSAVYDLLYHPENLTDIDFDTYARRLVSPWVEMTSRENRGIAVECRTLPVRLSPDVLIPLGLIVTELVTNALKYAYPSGGPGTIVLDFFREEGELVLRVSDDGCGMPDGARDNHGLGWELVSILSRQLRGRWKTCSEKGTCVEVRIPEPPAPEVSC